MGDKGQGRRTLPVSWLNQEACCWAETQVPANPIFQGRVLGTVDKLLLWARHCVRYLVILTYLILNNPVRQVLLALL